MSKPIQPVPAGFHCITPHLTARGGADALAVSLRTRVEDVAPEERKRRMEAIDASMAAGKKQGG
jgi:hypothetical protein